MDFQGPTPADYDNLRSLNAAFLELIQKDGARYLDGLSKDLAGRLQRLSHREIGWLAATPFLLFSLRERDNRFWNKLLNDERCRDLFSVSVSSVDETGYLGSAVLGFVWELASHNPFAARLLCGASTHWCEQIKERTIFQIFAVAAHRADLLALRAAQDTALWKKLLIFGLSQNAEARHAAQISALQYLLTRQRTSSAWQAAACASRNPALEVADDS